MGDEEPSPQPSASDRAALGALVESTYQKMKHLATRLPGVQPGTSISPSVVVNETYLKFLRSRNAHELAHREVIGIFVNLMRQILVDLVRRKAAQKRGPARGPDLIDADLVSHLDDPRSGSLSAEDLLTVRDLLDALRINNQRQAEIIEQRFYLGYTVREVATVQGTSVATVEREYAAALDFLREALSKNVT